MKDWEFSERMLGVCVYADITGEYTKEEINDMMDHAPLGQCIYIPVPYDLLFQWYMEQDDLRDYVRREYGKGIKSDEKEFEWWFFNESIADDCDSLYGWLVAHNYIWKRLK